MKEASIVRENLMNREGYSGYCGDEQCKPHGRYKTRWPRTIWNSKLEQWVCPQCGWVSQYPKDFIARYKKKWGK